MAAFPCPFCGHAIASNDAEPLDRCPRCANELLLAYRYRLISAAAEVDGGVLYEARDATLGDKVAALFVNDPADPAARERFVRGYRLFGELRSRGLVSIREVSRIGDPRPYVIMSWLGGGVLERRVASKGPLEPAMVWSVTDDLLTGVAAAHRELPALVHGHIHPGKIGFTAPLEQGGGAVLFGFEWSREEVEQDSALADSFASNVPPAKQLHDRATARDLQLLGRSIVYAATGQWLGEGAREQQRDRAKALIGGPLQPLVERLIMAGTAQGYASVNHARNEFEILRRGGDASHRPQPRAVLGAAVNSPVFVAARERDWYEGADAAEGIEELDELDEIEEVASEPPRSQSLREIMAAKQAAQQQAQQSYQQARAPIQPTQLPTAAAQHQRLQASVTAETKKSGSGCGVAMLIIVGVVGVGVFLGVMEEMEQSAVPEQVIRYAPEPIPAVPEPITPPPFEGFDAPPPSEPVLFERQMWPGEVIASVEQAPAKRSRCELWVEPETSGDFNCRWRLDCETKRRGLMTRYYGTKVSGWGRCTIVEGRPVFVEDLDDDDGDGALVIDARGEQPSLWLADRFANPPFAFVVRLDVDKAQFGGEVPVGRTESVRLTQVDQAELDRRLPGYVALAREHGFVLDSESEELPDRLTPSELQTTLQEAGKQLSTCGLGSSVSVKLTISGATGKVDSFSLEPEAGSDATTCVEQELAKIEFGRFRDESMSLTWNVSF